MGIAIWLVPTPSETAQIKKLMSIHPTPASSPASYPSFHPHITLASILGEADAQTIRMLRDSVPQGQKALSARFAAVRAGDHFFRSVYAAIAPTDALAQLHAHIHKALARDPNTPAYPHMSIYYIDDEDKDRRTEALQEMLRRGMVVNAKDGKVILDCGVGSESGAKSRLDGFVGSEIWIADCNG
ncbi:RNA ligase/cyclic nucleotide phosphodiesterase, partial [Amylostereum chailletii]